MMRMLRQATLGSLAAEWTASSAGPVVCSCGTCLSCLAFCTLLVYACIPLRIMLYAGETEEQYLATERLVREVGFDRVNTAAYSPRPNTPAAEWENQVGGSARHCR